MLKRLISFAMMVVVMLAIASPAHAIPYKGASIFRVGNQVWINASPGQAINVGIIQEKAKTLKVGSCGNAKTGTDKQPAAGQIRVGGQLYNVASLPVAPSKASCKSKDPAAIPVDWK